jgi:outer membrane biosynthesis protein TonB
LVFNQQGNIQNQAMVAPFSLSAIYVDGVKFSGTTLTIQAHEATIVRLSKSSPYPLRAMELKHQRLRIQIAVAPSQPSQLQNAVQTIFASNIQQALNAESRQQRKADLLSLPLLAPKTKVQAKLEVAQFGWPAKHTLDVNKKKGVLPPQPIFTPTPRYTDKARRDKLHGICEFYLVVNTQGFPQNIRVFKTLPDGLDERAIAAISQYRFRPATQNGKPVPIRMIVEMNFRLW